VSDVAWKLWAVIVLVGLANYLARLSFIALLARATVPGWAARTLRYVGVAMLTALVLPMVVAPTGGPPDFASPRVAATLVAGAVAFCTRSATWTLVGGMAALWTIEALLR
jgi:branched-subunit amino acid transport protein